MFSSDQDTGGRLYLTIINGLGLDAKDKDGFSDPYVVVRCAGQKRKTRYVPNTLNPVWKEV